MRRMVVAVRRLLLCFYKEVDGMLTLNLTNRMSHIAELTQPQVLHHVFVLDYHFNLPSLLIQSNLMISSAQNYI